MSQKLRAPVAAASLRSAWARSHIQEGTEAPLVAVVLQQDRREAAAMVSVLREGPRRGVHGTALTLLVLAEQAAARQAQQAATTAAAAAAAPRQVPVRKV